eukprot:4008533-Prorocentrum_lima.AAC.1
MTSSLVGSEMCIRDSSQAVPPCASRARLAPAVFTVTAAGCTTASSATVSYTHLTLPTICSV